jgi:hypothetical protein
MARRKTKAVQAVPEGSQEQSKPRPWYLLAPTRPALTIAQILEWADAHHARTGQWPRKKKSGAVAEETTETWKAISEALSGGYRGLPGGFSLADLLARERGVRPWKKGLPELGINKILKWADEYYCRHGRWPSKDSGEIPDSGGETWFTVHNALYAGKRGLPRNRTLTKLLSKKRVPATWWDRRDFTIAQILKWADDYHRATGRWPRARSGAIFKRPGETWGGVARALVRGERGLPGGNSLGRLLEGRQPPAPRAPERKGPSRPWLVGQARLPAQRR